MSPRRASLRSLCLLVLVTACGGGDETTEPAPPPRPVVVPVARLVVTTPTPVVVEPGETVALALRPEAADGTLVPQAVLTLDAGASGGIAVDGAVGAATTLRGVGVTLDTLVVRAVHGGATVEARVPVVVRPPVGSRLAVVGGGALTVDSAERRAGLVQLVRADGRVVPTATAPRGVGLADSSRLVLRPSATPGTFDVEGRTPGAGVLVLRLGGDSVAAVAATTTPAWTWRAVAVWQRIVSETATSARFLGIAAHDSALYEGPADGSAPPVRVTGVPPFVTLAGSDTHACALTADGVAWCTGANLVGEVGQAGAALGRLAWHVPWGPVTTSERFVALTANGNGTRGLTADGRWIGWGFAPAGLRGLPGFPMPAGCGVDGRGACTPVPLAPGRRFDRLSEGLAHCAREVGTGAWWCGGAHPTLRPGTNVMQVFPADSLRQVDLGRHGPVARLTGTRNGWVALATDGRALAWEAQLINSIRQGANQPLTFDTLTIRPEIRWAVAPVVAFGVREDGVVLGWRLGENLVGTPFVLSERPVATPAAFVTAGDAACFAFRTGGGAGCAANGTQVGRATFAVIPRPARP